MKLVTQQSNVRLDNVANRQEFTIVASPKMFKVLADGYANKIEAIVREISTNALDGHMMAGNTDTPFDVQAPTRDNPMFIVRDYGVGMSPDDIYNVFTKFGASTKENTNNQTGCLGLGSKTPFHYHTKTFTVESYQNGQKWVYSLFLNDTGIPELAETFSGPTDEPNGVKVSVPVNAWDIDAFQTSMVKVYQYFPVLPNISIDEGKLDLHLVDYDMRGSDWGLRKNGGVAKVVMGPVSYAIPLDAIDCDDKDILRCPIDLIVPMGSVDIDPYRENINVDNRTSAEIVRRLKNVAKEIGAGLGRKVESQPNLWDARVLFNSLWRDFPNRLFTHIDFGSLTWKGKKLFSSHAVGRVYFTSANLTGYQIRKYTKTRYRQNPRSTDVNSLPCDNKVVIVIDDLGKAGAAGRCMRHVCELAEQAERRNDWGEAEVFLLKFDDDAAKDAAFEYAGLTDAHLVKVSDLPAPVKKVGRYGGGRTTTKIVSLVDGHFERKNEYWADETVDLKNDSGVYVPLHVYDFKYKGRQHTANTLVRLLRDIDELGVKIPTIYGVRSTLLKDVEKNPNWTSFEDWLQNVVSKKIASFNYNQCLHDYHQTRDSFDWSERAVKKLILNLHGHTDCPSIEEFCEVYKEAEASSRNYERLSSLLSRRHTFPFDVTEEEIEDRKLEDKKNRILATYPLLISLKEEVAVDKAAQYVKLVQKNS